MPESRSPMLFDVPPGAGAGAAPASASPRGGAAFRDGKAPDALRTIGEVAAALGIRQHVLRYWEEQFPMLRPLKRSGARRYYRPADVALIERIDRLVHQDGYTLRGARLVLQGRGGEAAAKRAVTPAGDVVATAANVAGTGLADRLKAIRARLAAAAG